MAGLKFQCWHHMWVECVVSFLPCSKRFFSRNWGFPLSSKTNISKVQFNKEGWRVDKEPHYVDVQPLNLLYLYLFSICAFFSCESVKQWWICSGGAVGGGGVGVWAFTLFVGQSEAHTATKNYVWVWAPFFSLGSEESAPHLLDGQHSNKGCLNNLQIVQNWKN